MVIKELSSIWLDEKKQYVKLSTFAAYSMLVQNHISPWFGEKEMVEEEDVQNFVLSKLKDGLNEKTVKDIIVVLKMILKYGNKKRIIQASAIDVTYPLNHERKELDVMSKENYKKLVVYLNENFSFKNLGLLICMCTGLRIGEICALKWSDIDIEERTISINHSIQRVYLIEGKSRHTELIISSPKTKQSNRDVPMSNTLLKIIKPLMKVVNSDYFIVSNDSKPIEPRTYRNYYKKLIKSLGLPKLKFHGLRHSFATRCIESKADYKTVSTILGHSNITTTLNLYVHPDNTQKRHVVEKMMRFLE